MSKYTPKISDILGQVQYLSVEMFGSSVKGH